VEPLRDLVCRDDTPADWPARREATRARILAMLGPLPHAPVPLDMRVRSEEVQDGYRLQTLDYATEADDRVPACLLLPDAPHPKRPAVLCLHGTSTAGKDSVLGRGERQNRSYAPELARRGYVVLAPDAPAMGERAFPGATAPLDTAPFYARHPQRTIEGKKLWDHMRALHLRAEVPGVDPARIGAMGHSLGGRSTHYLAALDERVACAAVSCGIIPFAGYTHLFLRRGAYDPLPTVRAYIQEHNRLPFEKHELTALIAPRPVLLVGPANDPYCTRTDLVSQMAHQVFEVYRLLGAERNFSRFLHGDGHDTTPYVREILYGWLDLHLKA